MNKLLLFSLKTRISLSLIIVFLLIIYGCNSNNQTISNGGSAPTVNKDSIRKINNTSSLLKDTIKTHSTDLKHGYEVSYIEDTSNNYIFDLSFCLDTLLFVMHENNNLYFKAWKNRTIPPHYGTGDNHIYDKMAAKEVSFFITSLINKKELRTKYPKEYDFIIKNTRQPKDTFLSDNDFQVTVQFYLKLKGENTLMGISSMLYKYLIFDGYKFINAVEGNPQSIRAYKKWINDIERNEFNEIIVTPSQIIYLEREYAINKLKVYEGKDSLVDLTIKKLRIAKIQ